METQVRKRVEHTKMQMKRKKGEKLLPALNHKCEKEFSKEDGNLKNLKTIIM
jgi:hypothetical protein